MGKVNLDPPKTALELADDAQGQYSDLIKELAGFEGVEISDAEDFDAMTDVLVFLKGAVKAAETEMKSLTAGAKDTVKKIEAKFKPFLALAKKVEPVLKSAIVVWKSTESADQRVMLQAGDQEGAAARCVPEREELQFRETWKGTVMDIELIPDEYLLPPAVDEKKLMALSKTLGRDPNVPGWRLDIAHSVAVVTPKAK